MNVNKQRALANEIMETIYPLCPTAIVAGGAPRDWYFNNQAQDVDIFLYRPDLDTSDLGRKAFEAVGLEVQPLVPQFPDGEPIGHETYFLNPRISHVYDMEFNGLKFQFILMNEKTFTSVVPHFPLNLSRIWYKNGEIHPTGEFLHGVKNKALIKLDELYADGGKYITKIKERFPAYKYYSSVENFYKQDSYNYGKVHYGH